jgi:hypothetical protein
MNGNEGALYTNRAKLVLARARDLATERRDNCVGSLHVLLAILNEGTGAAAHVLRRNGVTAKAVWNQLDEVSAETDSDPFGGGGRNDSPLRLLIEAAHHESQRIGDGFVGTEHLLMGMTMIQEQPFSQLLAKLGLTPQTLGSDLFACLSRTENGQARRRAHMEHANTENLGGSRTMRCALCNATQVSKSPSVLPKCPYCGGVIWVPESVELPGALRRVVSAMRDISEASQKADSLKDLFGENLAKIAMIVGANELIIWDVRTRDALTFYSSHVHDTANQVLHVRAQHKRLLVEAAAREIGRTGEICSRDESGGVFQTSIFRMIGRLWMMEAILPTGASDWHVAIARKSFRTIALMLSQSRLIP